VFVIIPNGNIAMGADTVVPAMSIIGALFYKTTASGENFQIIRPVFL